MSYNLHNFNQRAIIGSVSENIIETNYNGDLNFIGRVEC